MAVGKATGTTEGPHFDNLEVGDRFTRAPALTLTEGVAAAHQAIVGDRLRLPLDATLARATLGPGGPAAHPALVWDIAIGQSTQVTGRVVANLFYRGLIVHRPVRIGDTLRTSTEVVGLRANRPREGRAPTGIAALRIRTIDQQDRPVLDFVRCAMLPVRDPAAAARRRDDLDQHGGEVDTDRLRAAAGPYDVDAFVAGLPRPDGRPPAPGTRWSVEAGDVVSSAPELARLTLNVARVHHDATGPGGERLVYGGHAVGLAAAQACRALPDLVTILAWRSCDHLGPVHEGDTLHSELELERSEPLPAGGVLLDLRSRVRAWRDGEITDVLDWRFVALAGDHRSSIAETTR